MRLWLNETELIKLISLEISERNEVGVILRLEKIVCVIIQRSKMWKENVLVAKLGSDTCGQP